MSFLSDIVEDTIDFIDRSFEWVGEKLGDTIDWAKENPAQAIAVGALIYGGYTMLAEQGAATTTASASELGTAGVNAAGAEGLGSIGAAGAQGVGAEGLGVAEGLTSTGNALGGANASNLGVINTSAAPQTGFLNTGGVSSGGYSMAGEASAGGDLLAQDLVAGNKAASAANANIFGTGGGGSLTQGGLIYDMPAAASPSMMSADTAASAGFWDSPYALPAATMLVGQGLNAYAAGKARDQDEERYNRQSYYGVANRGNNRADVGGVGAGLLNIGSNFSTARNVARPSYDVNYSPTKRR
jgi:hypothetical protein